MFEATIRQELILLMHDLEEYDIQTVREIVTLYPVPLELVIRMIKDGATTSECFHFVSKMCERGIPVKLAWDLMQDFKKIDINNIVSVSRVLTKNLGIKK